MIGRHIAQHKGMYIGNEAKEKARYLNLNYPIGHGIITDWDAMEQVLTNTCMIIIVCVLYCHLDLELHFL